MFGNEEENKNTLPNSMRIALITKNNANPDLPLKIQEKVLKDKNKNLEFIFVDNIKDLFKYKEMYKDEHIKGLIDRNWINNIKNLIPSVIILYYELQNGANKEPDEKIIYSTLEEIIKNSKYATIFLILVSRDMKENPYIFNFNDRQKPYFLKNFLTKDKFYMLPNEQVWKFTEFSDLCTKIYNCSFQFYKLHHRTYNDRRTSATSREEKIENDIKLGILSSIKTKKKNFVPSKYLEEAYELLCDKNFDYKEYKFGSQPVNIRNNFFEIRAIGDWLFFKNNIFLLNKNNTNQTNTKNITNKNIIANEIIEQIKKFERHIKSFSNINFYEKGSSDYFHFVEYYWLFNRYKLLKEYIEENNIKIGINKRILFKWFMTLFKEIYSIMKMIKYYKKYFNPNEFNLTEIKLDNEKILNIEKIEQETNIYYGKPPIFYYIDKDHDNKKEILGFNEEIYIKKFLFKNQIKYDEIIDKFKNKDFQHLLHFITYFKNNMQNNKSGDNLSGINLYLNIIKNIGINNQNIFEIDNIEFYTKLIQDYKQIKKFPKVYMNLIRQYINILNKTLKEDESSDKNYFKKELFTNLSILGNICKLNEEEENLFYQLLNDTDFILDKENIINLNYYTKNNRTIIKLNDLSINFSYAIKDINKYPKRTILDLIEYELNFNSSLSKEKIKFNSLQLFFEYSKNDKNTKKNEKTEIFIKSFTKEELSIYELDKNSTIKIPYKLIIKYKNGKVNLSKILFTLCKKENIIYTINLPYEIDKTIFLTGKEADIMKFNFPNKTLLSGINQLYKFSYSVNKKNIDNIKITEYKHIFSFQKADENSLKNEIFGEKNKKEINKLNEFLSLNNTDIPPSIFYFNEEKENMEEIKDNHNFEINYNNFESKLIEGKANFDILFKFFKNGYYLIKLDIKYIILHEEVDTKLEFNYSKNFYFRVINPLSMSYNIVSNNFLLSDNSNKEDNNKKKKEFLTNTPIKIDLIFNDELKEDIIIKDIQLIPKENNNFDINTTLKEMIDSKEIENDIKEEIFKISNSILYIIPIYLKFKNPYNDSIGKCKLVWKTKSLEEYENNNIKAKDKFNFLNETEFDLPNIYIKKMNIKYDYNYEIKEDNIIHLKIKIENLSNTNKRLLIQIGNHEETAFVLSGLTTYNVNLKNREIKNLFLKLYVIQNGEIKLPDVIIKEVDYDGKEYSKNNFYSEKIIVN